ncbi:MAG: M14 family zinc carboxypeptidase [Chloroflexota bacterium]
MMHLQISFPSYLNYRYISYPYSGSVLLCILFFLLLCGIQWLDVYAQDVPTGQDNQDDLVESNLEIFLPLIFSPAEQDSDIASPQPVREDSSIWEDISPSEGEAPHQDEPVSVPEIVRIFVNSQEQLTLLAEELDIWEEVTDRSRHTVTALVSPKQKAELLTNGYRVESDQELMEQYGRTLNLFGRTLAHTHSSDVGAAVIVDISEIPGFACFRTVEETYADLSTLAESNPNLTSWVDIGDSWNKVTSGSSSGYDIQALVLTNQSIPGPKPTFMLIAAIHAREYTTAEAATRYAEYLVDNYGLHPDVTWLLDYHEVHILPQTNPDGRKIAESGELWRKNRNHSDGCMHTNQYGVDLNRNSSFKWGLESGSSNNACNQTYRGSSAASEPEVQAIQNHALSIFPDNRGPLDSEAVPHNASGLFISLHSYGELVLPAWGWTDTPAPNSDALYTLGHKFGYYTDYKVCSSTSCLYSTSGTTDDWTYGELGVPSYTFELGNAFFQSCPTFEQKIFPAVRDALIYAAKAARQPYLDPAGPESVNLSLSANHVSAGTPVNLSALVDDSRYASNGGDREESSQRIVAARYSIDKPSWFGGTLWPMSASDGLFDTTAENVQATLDTSLLAQGQHTVFVEGQDEAGNWGVPSAIFLTITDASAPQPTMESTPLPTRSHSDTATPSATATPMSTPLPTEVPQEGLCTIYRSTDVPRQLPNGTTIIESVLSVADEGLISDLNVSVDMHHNWVGDLIMTLQHQETGTTVNLLERPGKPGEIWGCNSDHIDATFDDQATVLAEEECSATVPAIGGDVRPNEPLERFNGQSGMGTWLLTVQDNYISADNGSVNAWHLEICRASSPPLTETPSPPPTLQPTLESTIPPTSSTRQTPTETPAIHPTPTPFRSTPTRLPSATPTYSPAPTATHSPTPTYSPSPTHLPSPTTTSPLCRTYPSSNTPLALDPGASSALSSLTILELISIDTLRVHVDLSHEWIGDVGITIAHQESGIRVSLLDQPGRPESLWGCSRNDLLATFDDQAELEAEQQCDGGPAIHGNVTPIEPLDSFTGQPAAGTWQLLLNDAYPSADGGVLNNWSLEVCSQ